MVRSSILGLGSGIGAPSAGSVWLEGEGVKIKHRQIKEEGDRRREDEGVERGGTCSARQECGYQGENVFV